MSFGKKIRDRREAMKMTQEELSYLIQEDLSRQSVSKWERGEAYPDIENLLRMSLILGVSLDELFEDELTALSEDEIIGSYMAQKRKNNLRDRLLKNRGKSKRVEIELSVKNKFPLVYEDKCRCCKITNIKASMQKTSDRFIWIELLFEGEILDSWDSRKSVYFKFIDSEGVSVKTGWFDISANRKGEKFKSSAQLALSETVGDTCTIELLQEL